MLRGDEILICQRTKHQPMPFQWEFPGGKIEEGEQPRAALARELEEELGIVAQIGDEVARIKHHYKNGLAIELRFFEVRSWEGELENRIFKDIRWVPRESLPDYDFLEADKGLVEELAAGKLL